MDKKINNNGFDYVDLELPSGTLWATCNVGASKHSESGLYFQWGDTQGYTADQIGKEDGKKKFSKYWEDYKYGTKPNFTKYATNGETLELEDDAAHVYMGGDWHMPTPNQFQELIDNTIHFWTTLDGVNGMRFTSKTDTSKFIFIPAAGDAWNGSVYNICICGSIWSSMQSANCINCSHSLDFYDGGQHVYGRSMRFLGFSVRGVIG